MESAGRMPLEFSSYLGGSGTTLASAVAVDGSGNVYVTGWTTSSDLPVRNALQSRFGGSVDAFVAKFDSAGDLVYCTFLGGSGDDRAVGVAVDSSGSAYVTGWTGSADFRTTGNASQPRLAGGQDAFVAKLSPAGDYLIYSTLVGGTLSDQGRGIALDVSGHAYVVGQTTSVDFPTLHPVQGSLKGKQNAFVAEVDGNGALLFSTYLGGSGTDSAAAITVDGNGSLYVTGGTDSSDFPVVNALQPISGGYQDAFVTKFSPNGVSLVFSTYLGGSGGSTDCPESGLAIDVDGNGNAYVAGVTSSQNFPTRSAFQASLGGWTDAFLAKLSVNGDALQFSTYLGGANLDYATAVRADAFGNACVAGYSSSPDFPLYNPFQSGLSGLYDAFLSCLTASGNSLISSTLLGGSASDAAYGLAIDLGSAYLAGQTGSTDFPVQSAFQRAAAGPLSGFVAKLQRVAPPSSPQLAAPQNGASNISWISSLTWNAASGATSYSVYIGTSPSPPFVANASGLSYTTNTLSPATTYYWRIVANNSVAAASSPTWSFTTACSYGITPDSSAVASQTGTGSIAVTAPPGCTWTAISSDPTWLNITSGATGSGNGTVTYSVAANAADRSRSAAISVAGLAFPVTQAANPCTYALAPASSTINYIGGNSLTFNISTSPSACAWTVTTTTNWLIGLPESGTGNGTITYSVYPNYATSGRTGSIVVGGQNYTITQTGASGTQDERFVKLLYFNFYGRLPSDAEVAYQVTNGVGPMGRAQVALNFFNGQEFRLGGRYIAGLYFGLLGRSPDYRGWLFQRNSMARNIVDPFGLITNFLNSAEFNLKYGTLDDPSFVRLLYQQILLRMPSQAEVDFQVTYGVRAMGRVATAYGFLTSAEFQLTQGPQMSAFLLYACLLQRDATTADLSTVTTQIQGGASILSLIANVIATAEFQTLVN